MKKVFFTLQDEGMTVGGRNYGDVLWQICLLATEYFWFKFVPPLLRGGEAIDADALVEQADRAQEYLNTLCSDDVRWGWYNGEFILLSNFTWENQP